jgi:hypothetical protein
VSGQYVVSVPFGKYRIDGYELDFESANSVLPGKIDHPGHWSMDYNFDVTPNRKGDGITLRFVDPIIKNIPKTRVSVADDMQIEWESYPGAEQYQLQVYEKTSPRELSNNALFDWRQRPVVMEPHIRLGELGIKLNAGHYYVVEISALNESGRMLSETPRKLTGYDFEVVE